MTVISGKIVNLEPRAVNTKYGNKTTYTVTLDSGDRFDTSFKSPQQLGLGDLGDHVTVTVEGTKYGNKFKSLGGSPTTSVSAPPAASAGRSGGVAGRPFPVPRTSGEMAIIRQNALTNAVNLWSNYLSTLPPEAAEEVLKDDVEERIIATAYKFANFSSGQREVQIASAGSGDDASE